MQRLHRLRRWRVEKVHWVRVGALGLCVVGVCGLLSDPAPFAAPTDAGIPAPPAPPASRDAGTPAAPEPPPRLDLDQVLEATAEAQAGTGVVVHAVEIAPGGLIRLSCHTTHDDLRRIAAFRSALRTTALCDGRELRLPRVAVHEHRACRAHGRVDMVSQFEVEFAPQGTLSACPPANPKRLPCLRN